MSSEKVVEQLISLLSKDSKDAYPVVALSGDWGTGKTYLWKERVKPRLLGTAPLYVSLFGLKTVESVSAEILQAAIASDDPRWKELQQRSGEAFKRTAVLFLKLAQLGWLKDAIEGISAVVLPELVRGRLIVFDDIERKNDSLTTDTVLGLIDRYKAVYNCRFLLILNRGKLKDEEVWTKYREKVIDREVALTLTSDEAFDIANEKIDCKYSTELKLISTKLGITNIRALQKILRVAKTVLDNVPDVPAQLRGGVIPSLVLLPAIHFEARSDLPSKAFVMSSPHMSLGKEKKSPEEIKWAKLLLEIGFISPDDLEPLILNFLDTGLFEAAPFQSVVKGHLMNAADQEFQDRLRRLFHDILWDAHKSDAALCGEIRALIPEIHRIAAPTATAFAKQAADLGDQALATQLVEAWVANFKAKAETQDVGEPEFTVFRQQVDPMIERAVREAQSAQHPPLPILDAVKRMNSGWGNREVQSLTATTKETYVQALKSADSDDLELLLSEHTEWLTPGTTRAEMEGFKHALPNFVAACVELTAGNDRLARIIKAIFEARNLAPLLVQPNGAVELGKPGP